MAALLLEGLDGGLEDPAVLLERGDRTLPLPATLGELGHLVRVRVRIRVRIRVSRVGVRVRVRVRVRVGLGLGLGLGLG